MIVSSDEVQLGSWATFPTSCFIGPVQWQGTRSQLWVRWWPQ